MSSSRRGKNKKLHQRQRQQARHANERRSRERELKTQKSVPLAPRYAPPEPADYVFTFITEDELGRSETTLAQLRKLARSLPFEAAMLSLALWGVFIRSGPPYAAIVYSWRRPPSRSRLRIASAGGVGSGGFARRSSGGASPIAR